MKLFALSRVKTIPRISTNIPRYFYSTRPVENGLYLKSHLAESSFFSEHVSEEENNEFEPNCKFKQNRVSRVKPKFIEYKQSKQRNFINLNLKIQKRK